MTEEAKDPPHPYTPRSDEVLEKLAWDTVENKVFHSMYHMPGARPNEMGMTFMVLMFADQAYIDWMKESHIEDLYEYMDKAGPGAINGNPIFFSCNVLNKEDAMRLDKRVQEIQDFKQGRIEGAKT